MSLQEILDLDLNDKNVLIIGVPGSGKTHLSKLLDKGNHRIIHTDDFIPYGFIGSLYVILDTVNNTIGKTLTEGVQGYRMLRKGLELNNYFPDVVIECEISAAKQNEIYVKERDPEKIKYLKGFRASMTKVLNDYLTEVPKEKMPMWVIFDNNY